MTSLLKGWGQTLTIGCGDNYSSALFGHGHHFSGVESDMRYLLYANYIIVVVLFLFVLAGVYSTTIFYEKYGVECTITTIIGEEVTVRKSTIYESIFTAVFFALILMIIMKDTIRLRKLELEETE